MISALPVNQGVKVSLILYLVDFYNAITSSLIGDDDYDTVTYRQNMIRNQSFGKPGVMVVKFAN